MLPTHQHYSASMTYIMIFFFFLFFFFGCVLSVGTAHVHYPRTRHLVLVGSFSFVVSRQYCMQGPVWCKMNVNQNMYIRKIPTLARIQFICNTLDGSEPSFNFFFFAPVSLPPPDPPLLVRQPVSPAPAPAPPPASPPAPPPC